MYACQQHVHAGTQYINVAEASRKRLGKSLRFAARAGCSGIPRDSRAARLVSCYLPVLRKAARLIVEGAHIREPEPATQLTRRVTDRAPVDPEGYSKPLAGCDPWLAAGRRRSYALLFDRCLRPPLRVRPHFECCLGRTTQPIRSGQRHVYPDFDPRFFVVERSVKWYVQLRFLDVLLAAVPVRASVHE